MSNDKDTPKRHKTQRRGRPSTITKHRLSFGLRLDVALLNQLRALADTAQVISLNAYITAVLINHVTNTKAITTK
jgi:predicted HicB family RNase H-like nuclease